MKIDDIFEKTKVDVHKTGLTDSNNPLFGLPLWASDHKSFDEHCLNNGYIVKYSFQFVFYGAWEKILEDDHIYKIISDAVNIIDNIRVPHSEIIIVYRPSVVKYETLSERFPNNIKPYVEGVNISFAADFGDNGMQFLRMYYSIICLETKAYIQKIIPDFDGGLNISFFMTYLNVSNEQDRYSNIIESYIINRAFYICKPSEQLANPSPDASWSLFHQYFSVYDYTIGDPKLEKAKKFINMLYKNYCKRYNLNRYE